MTPPEPQRLRDIRFLLTDVDGVLTDGRLHFDFEGRELKTFHVYDGAGLAYWHRAGFHSGFLSGRQCTPVQKRAEGLKVHEIHLGHLDKLPVFEEILERRGLRAEEVAYLGDDLLDIPVLQRAGLACTVPNGRAEVRAHCHYLCNTPGGQGALREVVELILQAKGVWDEVLRSDGRG